MVSHVPTEFASFFRSLLGFFFLLVLGVTWVKSMLVSLYFFLFTLITRGFALCVCIYESSFVAKQWGGWRQGISDLNYSSFFFSCRKNTGRSRATSCLCSVRKSRINGWTNAKKSLAQLRMALLTRSFAQLYAGLTLQQRAEKAQGLAKRLEDGGGGGSAGCAVLRCKFPALFPVHPS